MSLSISSNCITDLLILHTSLPKLVIFLYVIFFMTRKCFYNTFEVVNTRQNVELQRLLTHLLCNFLYLRMREHQLVKLQVTPLGFVSCSIKAAPPKLKYDQENCYMLYRCTNKSILSLEFMFLF